MPLNLCSMQIFFKEDGNCPIVLIRGEIESRNSFQFRLLFVSDFTMPSEIVENGLPSSSFFSDELCLPNEVVIACPLIGFCFYCAVCLMEISS